MASLRSGNEGMMKIGIYGMGGVGKTTLAKALYNQLLERRFRCSCFLAEVRETSGSKNGLVSLQQQFINEFLKGRKQPQIHNVEKGTRFIRERFSSAKVMVLIDDIYDFNQYKCLVPGTFAPGSVVIITTRDEELLLKIEVERRYWFSINVLDKKESLALFSKHAFGNAIPQNALMVMFKDILSLAGGLPLALIVFGGYLSTQSVVGWKNYIEKLQQFPNSTIQQKLMISLDAIELEDPMLKKIFLDIACFFIGGKRRRVVQIMETYYSYIDHNIDILRKRCLLTINKRYELRMHDLLRDMGREVVRKKSDYQPGKYSRLWASNDIFEVLKENKGTKAIEGIIPGNFDYQDALKGVSFTTKTFKKMNILRFLYLSCGNVSGNFEHILGNLRWLHWDHFPLKCLPSAFCPQKLVILALPYSKMSTLWELNMDSHVFNMLTTLDMSYSQDLVITPDFTKLSSLKILNLKGCKSLEEVHISIGCLIRLKSLNLSGCVSLTSVPDNICNFRALKSLNVGGCSSLIALPMELGNIVSLTELNAWGLTTVSEIPNSILNLTKLVELNLSDKEFTETPSTSVSDSTPTGWDVFLSSCSADTHFTSQLSTALDSHEIRTCRDDPEQSTGELNSQTDYNTYKIALWESKTFVVVLSENYVSSERCLRELANIIEWRSRRLVIPVFYHIDASLLENQTRKFIEDFGLQILSEDERMKMNYWRFAVKEVNNLSGYHISDNGSEPNIISEIVDENIFQKKPEALSVSKYPLRLSYRVKDITALLSSGTTQGMIKFGIYGIAGVGKTTLAKALFEQLLSGGSFEGSCFLENVREVWQTFKGPEFLQHKLINDVLKKESEIKVNNVYQGTKLIKCMTRSTKVLVVIDDLDYRFQYNSLGGPFASGSVVIITTRDEKLLGNIGVKIRYRYMVNVLNCAESLALFTQHAFENAKLNKTLMLLSKDILHQACGLPLALKVFGAHLSSRSAVQWKEYIKKLQQIPNSTIQQKLMISLDALELDDSVLKGIFVDIACFFVGSKLEDVIEIMECQYSYLDNNIAILLRRCLLTVNRMNELEMHDLLRDIGREIARKSKRGIFLDEGLVLKRTLEGSDLKRGLTNIYTKYCRGSK